MSTAEAQAAPDEDTEVVTVMLEILAAALHLERAALLLQPPEGGDYAPVATVGRAPEHADRGRWSAIMAIGVPPQQVGLLLLALPDGAPLSATATRQAESVAEGLARIRTHARLQADLTRTTALLARTDRLAGLGTLAAGVVHEIRNPLVSVRTFLQLLPERLDDLQFRTEFRELALAEIERICELINDLLGFARSNATERVPVDLNLILQQTVRLLEPELRRQRIVVATTLAADLAPILADDGQIRQVAMNLIANAAEACDGPGEVLVQTARVCADGRDRAMLAVGDSGPGIAPGAAERLFEPFFTTKPEGSGLGLYIVRQIVTEHGGQIRTEQRPGGGALFSVFFPLPAERRDGRV